MQPEHLFRRCSVFAKQGLIQFIAFNICWSAAVSELEAQQPSSALSPAKDVIDPEFKLSPFSAELQRAGWTAYRNATPESLAALRDDDPLLRELYVKYGFNKVEIGPNDIALKADMRRREKLAASFIVEAFKHPDSINLRGRILQGVLYYPLGAWNKLLPLARQWYAQRKEIPVGNPTGIDSDRYTIARFLCYAGEPEDEAIIRDILGKEAMLYEEMRSYLARMEKLKQTKTSPAEVQMGPVQQGNNTPHKPTTPPTQQPDSTSNLTISAALIIATVALLGLFLFKRICKKRSILDR
ncbi:MAG TPA: hypothetical protein DDZ88_23720 [Verrucomicrobiales bacterium]|nr:hypothetical protein [Verrucomicrobiales bacterium]